MHTSDDSPPVDPALVPLVRAIARLAYKRQQREMKDAAGELAELRSALGLDEDLAGWKHAAEGLLKTFYDYVGSAEPVALRARLRLITAAVRELGPKADFRSISVRAADLAESEVEPRPIGDGSPKLNADIAKPKPC